VPINEVFFSDGHSKVEINSTVRGKDLFFLTDIENCSIEYKMRGFINHTSPNDLFQQLKDGINASNCHADKINIIMPLLFNSRQHRRNTREPLSCGAALRELDNLPRIKSLVTFDAHDQSVEHATHNMEFDNIFVTNTILESFINNVPKEQLHDMVFIAPDGGANGRRDVFLNSFNHEEVNKDAGGFYKLRDFKRYVNGKNPVISHEYMGRSNLQGKTAIIVDDMIASGGSMFDTIDELKKRGIEHVYIMVTFALFTEGIDTFKKYANEGLLDGLYVSNLSYIPEEYKQEPWLHVCDCSKTVAEVIYNIHNDLSITSILTDRSQPLRLLEKKFKKDE
jgi:ribose-phosphate pyrophosphokinase